MKKLNKIGGFSDFLLLEERKPAKKRTGLYRTFVLNSISAIAQTRSLIPTVKKIEDVESYKEASEGSKKQIEGISKKLDALGISSKLKKALSVTADPESHKEMFSKFVSIENSLIDLLKDFKEAVGSYSSKMEDSDLSDKLSKSLSKEVMDLSGQVDQYPGQAIKASEFFLKAIEAYKKGADILLDSEDDNAIDMEEATAEINSLSERVLNEGLGFGEDFLELGKQFLGGVATSAGFKWGADPVADSTKLSYDFLRNQLISAASIVDQNLKLHKESPDYEQMEADAEQIIRIIRRDFKTLEDNKEKFLSGTLKIAEREKIISEIKKDVDDLLSDDSDISISKWKKTIDLGSFESNEYLEAGDNFMNQGNEIIRQISEFSELTKLINSKDAIEVIDRVAKIVTGKDQKEDDEKTEGGYGSGGRKAFKRESDISDLQKNLNIISDNKVEITGKFDKGTERALSDVAGKLGYLTGKNYLGNKKLSDGDDSFFEVSDENLGNLVKDMRFFITGNNEIRRKLGIK